MKNTITFAFPKRFAMQHAILTHSILRWVLLFLLLFTIVSAFIGKQQQKSFTKQDNALSLLLVSVADLQLLIGLYLYIMGAWGIKNIQQIGMSAAMKDSFSRFFAVEHIMGMVIAIVLLHIGRAKSKRALDDIKKHKVLFTYTLISFILILISIPWPFRKGFAMLGWI
ncbi:MAG: hypothetical protein R2831_05445 [Chitinophagaceae bacterium]